MILRSLQIKDFRGIRDLEIDFHEQLTVIVGRNGAGKTSILDALAGMLQSLRMLWPDSLGKYQYRKPSILKEDVRYGAKDCLISLSFDLKRQNPVLVDDHGEKISVRFSELGKNTAENKNMIQLFRQAEEGNFQAEAKPLFIYYHQERGFKNKAKSTDVFNSDTLQDTSLQADLKAINDLEAWWDKLDAQEARQVRDSDASFRDPQLQAIRLLIDQIDSFSGISFSSTSSQPGLFLTKNDGSLVHVDKLSSGERSYIILLADLARRLQVVAPSCPISEIPGIVLIDEIELNLHPTWQSEIISTLCKAFRKCQFIVTTHSPQVLSSALSENIRVLNVNEFGEILIETPISTKGRTSNYLLEGVFGASERFPPIDRLIDQFNDAIDDANLSEAKSLFDRISGQVEGEPSDLLVLKKRLRKLEGAK